MYLKANIPTGAGPEGIIYLIERFNNVGVICNQLLKPQYDKLAEKLRCRYQINMRVYTRQDYYNDIVEFDLNRAKNREADDSGNDVPPFDAFLIDDYPDALNVPCGNYPKMPVIVVMQELFYEHRVLMIVI